MTLRLKRLELQGFKSFASRTVFDLAEGVTAVIGPNGSGKSNFSDAVRWVLGEQSNTALRGRRGEDVIFAGGGGRAALGMAEAIMTLDNTGGELPLEFSEVTIARRIFRDGDTQYLINGGRVRLRDVLAVTAPLGQSYTVIGQGLVDAALSARPEERRGLFEHAAGITPFRIKRAEAERRLAETEANCARLLDLRAELEPRLKSLERAAKGAQEWNELRERLRGMQQRLYADLWREAAAALAAAEAAENEARTARDTASARIAELTAAAEETREATERQAKERRALAEQQAAIARWLEPLRRELAVDEERLAAARRRLADTRDRAASLAARRETLAADVTAGERDLAALETALTEARQAAEAAERDLAGAEQQRAALARRERDLAAATASGERDRLAMLRRRAASEERRAALVRDRERAGTETAAAGERLAALVADLAALDTALRQNTACREEAAQAEQAASAATAAAVTAEREAATAATAAERRVTELRARLDGLQKLAASGEGFYTGVRAVLAASHAGQLVGIIGPVAQAIEAPADLETAIEVALGGHLQDLIAERWADAEAAIAFLKDRRAGRATFQPLDSLRLPRDGGRDRPASGPGVLGVAADLVRYEERFAALARGLLGRTLVVEDLAATRQALARIGGGWSIVTRAGEIARASGAVTGGSAARDSGLLARARALRELPRQLTAAEGAVVAATEALGERTTAVRTAREAQAQCERQVRDLARDGDDLRHRLARLEHDRRAAEDAAAARERQAAALAHDEAALDTELAANAAQETDLAARLARLEQERATAEEELRALDATGAAERPRLTALRADAARLEEQRRGQRRQIEAGQGQLVALDREAGALAGGATTAEREERELLAAIAARQQALTATEQEAEAVAARLAPLDAALAAASRAEAEASAALGRANEEALRRESALGTRAVETARRRADFDALARRVREDLETDDPAALFTAPAEPLPAEERATLTGQVERLAARLRRIGPPNPEIVAEWESEAARWRSLTDGLSDVESAARSLRGVLAELDQTMAERFTATFERVATEFQETFTDLFGGGAARLVLAAPSDDGADGGASAGGVEIIAQPPGKRLQALSLLSGGERALTASALLFAILRVNPSPFCVLDEVDAALDESNVVRFRERLKRLADRTQFVVITHNRGTIEGADTLYGITMGPDGVSRALSLRLNDALARTAG
ncbi:MAG: chromosome segregation protein SMC [Thermomicrobiales bacterium]